MSDELPELTPPMMRALDEFSRGELKGRGAKPMRRRLIDARLLRHYENAGNPDFHVITDVGKMVLQAYRMGRRRWGAR